MSFDLGLVRRWGWGGLTLLVLLGVSALSALHFAFGDRSWAMGLFWADLSLTLLYSARFIYGGPLFERETRSTLILYALASFPLYAALVVLGVESQVSTAVMVVRLLGVRLVKHSLRPSSRFSKPPKWAQGTLLGLVLLSLLHWMSCVVVALGPGSDASEGEIYRQSLLLVLRALSFQSLPQEWGESPEQLILGSLLRGVSVLFGLALLWRVTFRGMRGLSGEKKSSGESSLESAFDSEAKDSEQLPKAS